jgi:putative peptide zinc metalloprotease protein
MSRFLDASWHRVANLTPRLADHVQVQKHRYRGKPWYVLVDPHHGRTHRLTPNAFKLIQAMDGKLTMDKIWQDSVAQSGADAPGQTAVIHLLGQLHSNDLLVCNVAPDSAELFARFDKQSRSLFWKNLRNPLSIRIPLLDPDAFLRATLGLVRPCFSRLGLLIWLIWISVGLLLAAEHWQELTDNVADRVLSAHNLFMMWLAFPVVKILHELGHAYACRVMGGPVHEMGVMILMGMIVPYVEASASSGFRSKWQRFLVGAAGMMVELMLASTAMMLWTMLEPGALRSGLYNVMIIASVSTLIFNGNPLMRYDGYYMLSDWLEIPNLAGRGPQYWYFLINRHGFGVLKPERFDASSSERRWFLVYTPLSYVYRLTVMLGIALYLAEKYLLIGLVMGLIYVYSLLIVPAYKAGVYLLTNPGLMATRKRALGVSGGFLLLLSILIGFIPLPLRTQFEGVIWLPAQAQVRAGSAGFVSNIVSASGSFVKPGDVLLQCEDAQLMSRIEVYKARIEEIKAQRLSEWQADRNQAEITRQALMQAEADLNRAQVQAEQLTIRSHSSGRFFLDREFDLPGRFLKQGDLVGFVVDRSRDIVRIVVSQDDIDLVRRDVESIQVRLAENPQHIIPARLLREVPAADTELPSPALATEGGGQQELDPREQSHTKAMNRLFQFDLVLLREAEDEPDEPLVLPYGTRAHVRFVHHAEPLFNQVWRRIRQLFLSRLAV